MKTTLFTLLLLLPFAIFGQPVNNYVNNVTMPAPNAASLGKYGDIPVSYNTGVPSIGIPIHTLQEGPLSLPISLSYHAGGVRVAEPASWVGLGWSLQAGGYVSRTVQGIADERLNGYLNTGAQLGVNGNGCVTVNNVVIASTVAEMANGARDGEPDVFSFGVGGYNGKFYIQSDGAVVLVPKQDIKVQYTLDAAYGPKRLKAFTITAPDGTKYLFGDIGDGFPAIEVMEQNDNNFWDANAWYLKRISTYDDKFQINFSYVQEKYSYLTRHSGTSGGFTNTPGGVTCNKTDIDGFRPSTIATSTEKVTFLEETLNRRDLAVFPGSQVRALDKIRVEPAVANASYCKVFDLTTDYFVDNLNPQSDSLDRRLRLTAVQEKSCDGTDMGTQPYLLDYYGLAGNLNFLPNRASTAIDHWGYYNGATTNPKNGRNMPYTKVDYWTLGTPPPPTRVVATHGGSNRETNEANMLYGTLKGMTYPTGGNTQFEYEANDYHGAYSYIDSIPVPFNLSGELCSWNETETDQEVITFTTGGYNFYEVRYKWINQPFTGYTCCQNQTARLKVYQGATLIATVEGNTACPSGTPAIATGYLRDLFPTLQNNVQYTFKMYVFSIKTAFTLMEEETISQTGNRKVGGLRVKKITNSDAVSSANDVVRTYEYRKASNPSQSSGKLINLPNYSYIYSVNYPKPPGNGDPCSGYVHNVFRTHFWISDNAAPLGSFEGNHISYLEVKENLNGNGHNFYTYFDETFTHPTVFPFPPTPPMVNMGNISSQVAANSSSTTISSTNNSVYSTDAYQNGAGTYIKTRWYSNGSSTVAPWVQYSIRTKPFRLASTTSVIDGVSTTTTFAYDPANLHHKPEKTEFYNSDGKKITTIYGYPTNSMPASNCLRLDFVAKNMLATQLSVKHYVDDVLVSGDSIRWWKWTPTGFTGQACNAAGDPHPVNVLYPYEFYRYEMTYNDNGQAQPGATWDRQAVITRRWAGTGLPYKSFVACGSDTTCWKPEFYEWGPGGLLKKRTYNNDANAYKNFVTQYDYFTGTRLISRTTSLDGQYTDFAYDKLMRPSTATSKLGNVQTTFTYQYKNSTNPRSYVKARTTYAAVPNSSLTERAVWQYFDGLGRPVQMVDQKHSPAQKDVVVITEYDNQGRTSKVYEPFEQNQVSGAFVASLPSGQPFTKTDYNSDPLNRAWKVTPPAWYPTIYTYGSNLGTNVKLNHATNTWYPANSLNVTTVEDPNGNRSFTFTDKKGRIVLGRRRNNSGTQEANTYNLYDNKDRLTTVIPPDATISNADLLFKYLYDAADNMTSKDVPDAAPMSMKYDSRNLMTLVQDGNLAEQSKWLGTKYDIYGRAAATGFATGTDANTFTIASTDTLTRTTFDLPGQNIYKGKVRLSKVKILDGGNRFITTDYTYDAHGRVSGTTANNHLTTTPGNDIYTFTYDWADNRLTSTRNHKRLAADAATTIVETTTYDHAGRNKLNKHKLGTAAEVTLSQLNYNAKDELVEKNLGVGATNLQSLDYFYNDQGWLTRINQATLATTGLPVTLASCTLPTPSTTGNENDLFYLELLYDGQFPGMTGDTLQRNGNINQMQWRTRGRERQAYNFSYDYLDRLRSAVYADVNDAGTVTTNNRFNESLTYADARGNIGTLRRQGPLAAGGCTYGQIDNLSYTYYTGMNRLKTITDGSTPMGFKPLAGATDYLYDANGNMYSDPHKGLTITYNHLNLPKTFNFGGGKVIDILYDAAGNKLRKTIIGSASNYTQEYISGIEYRGTVREAIYTAEGRVFYTSPTTTRYEYTIKDHLGNARLSFTDVNANGSVDFATEVLQENHYYPFGLGFDGNWKNDAARDNRYQYNGKEINDDFGLNWYNYGFRWYDASICRFPSVDPIIDQFPYVTPFNYAENEPVRHIDLWGLQMADPMTGRVGPYSNDYIEERSYEYIRTYTVEEEIDHPNAEAHAEMMKGIINPETVGTVLMIAGSGGRGSNAPNTASNTANGTPVKAAQLAKNAKKGADFESKVLKNASKTQDDVVPQITVKTNSGTKTRIDVVGKDKKTGDVKLTEAKSSKTANLTKNQKKAFPEIEKSGGTVSGKGKGNFPGGTKIPPTKVDVVRPKN
jgi:RHS repeat-associated protein